MSNRQTILIHYTIRIQRDLLSSLKDYCDEQDRPVSSTIRFAIKQFLKDEKKQRLQRN